MGILDELLAVPINVLDAIIKASATTPFLGEGASEYQQTNPLPLTPSQRTSEEKFVRTDFLMYEALVLGGIVAAPVIYRAAMGRKKRKIDERMAGELEAASARSVALLASIGPAIGFPMAYMSVQCLENRGVISKGLGNAVQTLMATAAAGQAASGIAGLIGSAAKLGK